MRFPFAGKGHRQLAAFLVALLMGAADQVTAQKAPKDGAAKPVCAIIDADELAVTPVLEVRLLEEAEATWVERTQIERVLAEQELQAAFGAEGVERRSALGQLLKADVLVLLRSQPNPEQGGPELIDCVVCETRHGLRLHTVSLVNDQDVEALAVLLEQAVQKALQKREQKIESIVAVPPFLSEDLDFQHNHLQVAYAKLVEQALLDKPGVLVVELLEAQTIAKELALDKQAAGIGGRKLPHYVMGRYRHDGTGQERRLRMSLRLVRGKEQITLKGIKDLVPSEAATWILKKTTELSTITQNATTQADVSPDAEAKQLAARARDFQRLGNWAEAYSLYEASLLLKDDEEVRMQAVIVTGNYSRSKRRGHDDIDVTRIKQAFLLYERGLEHLARYLDTAPDLEKYRPHASDFTLDFERLYPHLDRPIDSLEVIELESNIRRRRAETYLRIARARANAGHQDYEPEDNWAWDARAVSKMSEEEQFATILRVARDWKDLPDIEERILRMTVRGSLFPKDTPAFRGFLDALSHISPHGTNAATRLNDLVKRSEKQEFAEAQRKRMAGPSTRPRVDPVIQSVQFTLAGEAAGNAGVLESLQGTMMPLDKGVDLFCARERLFVMEKPGQLRLIYEDRGRRRDYESHAYDGQRIWLASFEDGRVPQLLAIDPTTKEVVYFTADDGLPFITSELGMPRQAIQVAAVAPGHVCIAGSLGRTWIANVFLSVNGDRHVDVFHEAREAANSNESTQDNNNAHVAFKPGVMYSLFPDNPNHCRIVLGRDGHLRKPLVIDPHNETVRIGDYELSNFERSDITADQRAIYCLKPGYPRGPTLLRVTYPAEQMETMMEDVPQGHLVVTGNHLHILSKKWWIYDLRNGTLDILTSDVPWFHLYGLYMPSEDRAADLRVDMTGNRVYWATPSQHYGPMALVPDAQGKSVWYYHEQLKSASK